MVPGSDGPPRESNDGLEDFAGGAVQHGHERFALKRSAAREGRVVRLVEGGRTDDAAATEMARLPQRARRRSKLVRGEWFEGVDARLGAVSDGSHTSLQGTAPEETPRSGHGTPRAMGLHTGRSPNGGGSLPCCQFVTLIVPRMPYCSWPGRWQM